MADKKVTLTKADRRSVMLRSQFLQGSWNYERMQNGGWVYSMIPALKKLYPGKEEATAALKRHLEFFNTHPYIAAPIMGVTLALEEERANGAPIDDAAIQGVKVGMMGPLAGVGDPVFWFTIRPILGAIAASLATSGSIIAPLFFFIVWNVIRIGFLWFTQEFGYKQGSEITKDLSGGLLQTVTKGASILGMFVMGVLVPRWTSINFPIQISKVELADGAYINFPKGEISGNKLQEILSQQADGLALSKDKITTLQNNLDQLIPGFAALLLTFLCMWLLKKKVNPIIIIFGLFAVGIVGHYFNIL
ncbi:MULTISPECIES: PTS system mannose/fructose/sorbose family transporter subunit IID [unclassified Enterococcus]|uniref:PTS system mannose/fructose/sorbose family transporter subunit IID n=1 Tax=unclassified Enterococcus TaxID=2608891 RepID=UPI001554DC32|nr:MULTISPECIES: PTS system mannose/fructose/sorbose family transporter subunit IID [unclassified Enterococcus]MBS7577401.1 PTS mannose/fructose/sorbose transporter family subunit IID [Enterococcus sp. MMGLQ5-2]MBS7584808.1 PTS mannose/fructose/sorbose transporter family subunit IID [Enterococcus sp. MMGLQ5-1]NPD12663.1 PTS mannose/fructose/sorbose transporter family subunit IID [Enterococcus sp. MMGLQ5-1]NPD37235.1 PTS mannose/fructose/sorbose transporter family subunit IID [Enterococcus sp. M